MFGYSELVVRKELSFEETISAVSLEWITGDIHIFQSDNDVIKMVQITDAKFPERNLFHHKVSNGKLFLSFLIKDLQEIILIKSSLLA